MNFFKKNDVSQTPSEKIMEDQIVFGKKTLSKLKNASMIETLLWSAKTFGIIYFAALCLQPNSTKIKIQSLAVVATTFSVNIKRKTVMKKFMEDLNNLSDGLSEKSLALDAALNEERQKGKIKPFNMSSKNERSRFMFNLKLATLGLAPVSPIILNYYINRKECFKDKEVPSYNKVSEVFSDRFKATPQISVKAKKTP